MRTERIKTERIKFAVSFAVIINNIKSTECVEPFKNHHLDFVSMMSNISIRISIRNENFGGRCFARRCGGLRRRCRFRCHGCSAVEVVAIGTSVEAMPLVTTVAAVSFVPVTSGTSPRTKREKWSSIQ
jgi:hypothetical protein